MTNYENAPSILLVEDSSSTAVVYQSYLEPQYSVTIAPAGLIALDFFSKNTYLAVILDVQLPDISGMDVLKNIRQNNADIPVIIITAHGSVDTALEAMRLGATDFLSKPFDKARLEVTLQNSLKGQKLSHIVNQYERSCHRDKLHNMIGSSLAMQSVYNIIENASQSKATVFITGESGTGKELCAEAIHMTSQRSNQEFVALNCAAIPRDLIESEIFGHVKGAFTGASSNRIGAASRANKGTLFLDEIGELPMELQSKLLRFIQTGRFQPVGSNKEEAVDLRFVCATNRDPLEEVKQGRFREDLYYRLHVIPIHMPPLRDRNQDCMQIAAAMLNEFARDEGKSFNDFDEVVTKIFLSYQWPGNVRELGNVVRNIVVLNDGQSVSLDMLPSPINQHQVSLAPVAIVPDILKQSHSTPSIEAHQSAAAPASSPAPQVMHARQIEPLWLTEKTIIENAITLCKGNIPKAAAFLEISASTIYRKKQQWEAKELEV
jgi:two-component system, repressor protein LuxO